MSVVRAKVLGQHIVADPKICHGKLTFAGTRVLVADVLEMVAQGMPWKEIVQECHGGIDQEMIAEAVRLAGRAFLEQTEQHLSEPSPK
jgi:uncharacterized protein (DUF433 family)